MKKISLLILPLLFSMVIFAQKSALKNIDKDLTKLLKNAEAPGFAVAIVKGKEVIYSKGFGYRDLENKKPVDANTLFAIGSTSKAFTTTLLGQLREEGKLEFEDSPIKYIPELRFYNKTLDNNVNIVDMMSHRTGLPRHDYSWYLFPVLDKDSLLMRVQYHEPFAEMREEWYYNNFMYLVQGVIAERITGKTWEENMYERFFDPLDMKTSNVNLEEWFSHSNIAKGYATTPGEGQKKLDYFNIAAMSPAGSINSSVNEMTAWLKAWVNGGKYNGKEIIPSKFYQEAMNPHMLVGNGKPGPKHPNLHLNSYGYAWFLSSYKGHYRAEHGGNIDGFTANVAFFPTDSISIVVLANQNGSLVPKMARNIIADHLLGVEKTDWNKDVVAQMEGVKKAALAEKQKVEDGRVKNTRPSRSLMGYTGKYNHPGYGDFSIELKNDSLFAHFVNITAYLDHYHYDVFNPFTYEDQKVDTNDAFGLKFNFIANDMGDISHVNIKLEPTLEALSFKRKPSVVALSDGLKTAFIGVYELQGMEVKIYLDKSEKDMLMFVPGQPEYTLVPISNEEFIVEGLDGYKVKFGENSLTLIQPNGNFKLTKKN